MATERSALGYGQVPTVGGYDGARAQRRKSTSADHFSEFEKLEMRLKGDLKSGGGCLRSAWRRGHSQLRRLVLCLWDESTGRAAVRGTVQGAGQDPHRPCLLVSRILARLRKSNFYICLDVLFILVIA